MAESGQTWVTEIKDINNICKKNKTMQANLEYKNIEKQSTDQPYIVLVRAEMWDFHMLGRNVETLINIFMIWYDFGDFTYQNIMSVQLWTVWCFLYNFLIFCFYYASHLEPPCCWTVLYK